ncbi:acyl-CoA dehydrogenase family protein [Mycobacterium tilburgii]|uniref:acyl-CoA dehydrogenase family protein n=1 Tax=Mycobacterium tilburgii TaxID=44467 RepID=UPI0021B20E6F|nr:acyl-CoA dehydrogenase family protein [Mycobacterium tilburgii]
MIVGLAKSIDGYVAVVVRGCDSVTVIPGESIDPAQPVSDVEIDAEPLTSAPINLESALTAPLVAVAADLVGVAGAVLQRSVEHAKTRRQFGTPIGAFQGVKHALVDNYVAVERARSLTYTALPASPTRSPYPCR